MANKEQKKSYEGIPRGMSMTDHYGKEIKKGLYIVRGEGSIFYFAGKFDKRSGCAIVEFSGGAEGLANNSRNWEPVGRGEFGWLERKIKELQE